MISLAMPDVATLIQFKCGSCGRDFTVPANFAGRRAKCKTCGTELTVPPVSSRSPAAVSPAESTVGSDSGSSSGSTVGSTATRPHRLSPRERRLTADYDLLKKTLARCGWIRLVNATGSPPDTYEIEFEVAGLQHGKSPDKPVPQIFHRAEIKLTGEYPRTKPLCRMLTPVFHPNIDTATICVGDHWTAGERLVDLVIRIAEMLCFQDFNIKSPLDAEAAMWADLNAAELPLDSRNLHPPENE